MRILNFLEFSLNESSDMAPDEFYKVPGINNFMDDGYEISAENCIDAEDYPSSKVAVTEETPTSIKICYCDTHGNPMEEIWLPKDSLEVKESDDNQLILTIHPECRWINNPENREKLEDFIENFDNFRSDEEDKTDRHIESIKDDLENFMEAIGFEVTVSDVTKVGDNEYEITLDNNIFANVKKRSLSDVIGKIKLYKDKIIGDPKIEISGTPNGITLVSNIPDLFRKEIECDMVDFEESPYLRYLLRKPLEMDTNSDRDKLATYYSTIQSSHDKSRYESDNEKIRNSAREESYHIKDLRKMLAQFLSEDRLRKISSDY